MLKILPDVKHSPAYLQKIKIFALKNALKHQKYGQIDSFSKLFPYVWRSKKINNH